MIGRYFGISAFPSYLLLIQGFPQPVYCTASVIFPIRNFWEIPNLVCRFSQFYSPFPNFTSNTYNFSIRMPLLLSWVFRFISSKRFGFLFIYGASPDRKKNNNCHHAIFSIWFLIKIMCIHFL